jgi:hypothetical protein
MYISPGILSSFPSAGTTYATWSPVYKSSWITLKNSNLKFESSGINTRTGTGIATLGKNTGKWYWEVYLDFVSSNITKIGIANYLPSSANLDQLGAQDASVGLAYGYRGNPANCFVGPSGGSVLGTGCTAPATGQLCSLAFDADAHTLAFYINGLLKYTVTGIAPGTWYPACCSDGGSGAGTANFGQNAWSANATVTSTRNTLFASGYNPGVF